MFISHWSPWRDLDVEFMLRIDIDVKMMKIY